MIVVHCILLFLQLHFLRIALSTKDHGFHPHMGQPEDNKTSTCRFSVKLTVLRERGINDCPRVGTTWLNGTTCEMFY